MACDTCYRRKVRCDLDNGPPCVACMHSGAQCSFTLAEQHKAKRRAKKRALPAPPFSGRHDVSSVVPASDNTGTFEVEVGSGVNNIASCAAKGDETRSSASLIEDEMTEAKIARTALTQFFHCDISKFNWETFREKGYPRIAYLGTPSSNLSTFVKDEAQFSGTARSSLHLPFPAIRPTVSWRPTLSMPLIKWYARSFPDDASMLPAQDVRDDLVESFFLKVHPGFPIVDESEFRKQYKDSDNPPPLLLLQAVLLVGAHVSMHTSIRQQRPLVKMVIFRRAKALFDMHFENDRMHAVQASLLFTWHFEGADDVCSNAFYWTGIACRIAFGLGMHRDLGTMASTMMPVNDRRIYRRIWWTLFQVEILSSLHHGRPSMIEMDEIDQSPLVPGDFVEQNGCLNQQINIDYCIQNTELCRILSSMTKISSPGAMRKYSRTPELFQPVQDDLDRELASWYLSLPSTLVGTELLVQRFWALQIQMHYNLALLHLHRLPPNDFPRADSAHEQTSRETCLSAAMVMSKILGDIVSSRCMDQGWITMLTSLLAAAIQFSHEARTAADNNNIVLAIQAQGRLERLLPAAAALAKYWPGAEAISKLYTDLLIQAKRQSKSLLADSYQKTCEQVSCEPQVQQANQFAERMEAGDDSGSGGIFDAEWHTLFGVGSPLQFSEFDVQSIQDWLCSDAGTETGAPQTSNDNSKFIYNNGTT